MSVTLTHICRHPLKALGREALEQVTLAPEATLPWDRVWAVTHDRAKIGADGWHHKANFLRGVTEPALMAVTSRLDEAEGTLALDHPDAGALTIRPDEAGAGDADWPVLSDWLSRIWSADLPAPTGIYRAETAAQTDRPEPWLALHSHATHRAVEQKAGTPLSIDRWRGNLWLDGLAPWQEFEWVGHRITIGEVTLQVDAPITRCKATHANPKTGRRDVDTLGVLRTWDHQDFGVFARVVSGGTLRLGDTATVPA